MFYLWEAQLSEPISIILSQSAVLNKRDSLIIYNEGSAGVTQPVIGQQIASI